VRTNLNLTAIYGAAFLRSLGVGLTGVLLGVYLSRIGFSVSQLGLVITAGLAGAALGTTVVSFFADHLGRQRTLVVLGLLGALGGVGLIVTTRLAGILLMAFVGMINGMGTDRGPCFALEQAIIPQAVSADRRTWALSWHSVTLDAGHAVGAIAAGLPILFSHWLKLDLGASYRLTFGLYAVANVTAAAIYFLLSPAAEVTAPPARDAGEAGPTTRFGLTAGISAEAKAVVYKLAAFSGIDSLGGGFLTDALIAYWFFRRFGIPEASLGLLFFTGHLLNSVSYLSAAWLARRIGLLNTMVFTHIPSSLFLIGVPLVPTPALAVLLFLGREALVEMDVPTRQSYIMAVVQPHERTFASGVSNLTRSAARAVTPSVAGFLMQSLSLAAPLYLGGSLKIVYDLLIYGAFRRLKPPEEQSVPPARYGAATESVEPSVERRKSS
jgi:MFS family permease